MFVPRERHVLKGRDLADARYHEQIGVEDMADAAGMSRAHFTREFSRIFGEPPHQYLLARRLERAAALLRNTDRPVNEVCLNVGFRSVGSFTTRFTERFGTSPTTYRAQHPPAAAQAMVPGCITRIYGRVPVSTNGEAQSSNRT
jgi:AraC-like DNA-binding protein